MRNLSQYPLPNAANQSSSLEVRDFRIIPSHKPFSVRISLITKQSCGREQVLVEIKAASYGNPNPKTYIRNTQEPINPT